MWTKAAEFEGLEQQFVSIERALTQGLLHPFDNSERTAIDDVRRGSAVWNQLSLCYAEQRSRRVRVENELTRRKILIGFHWTTVLLVFASFSIAWLRNGMDDFDRRLLWLDVHRFIGLLVLIITVVRLPQRAITGSHSKRNMLSSTIWLASRVTHALLYAGLICMPLLGWAQSSARSRHLVIFGQALPRLVRHNPELADTLGWWHEQVGWALLGLIALHVSAALIHHFVLKDDTLKSMLAISSDGARSKSNTLVH